MRRFLIALPMIATLLVTLVISGCHSDCCLQGNSEIDELPVLRSGGDLELAVVLDKIGHGLGIGPVGHQVVPREHQVAGEVELKVGGGVRQNAAWPHRAVLRPRSTGTRRAHSPRGIHVVPIERHAPWRVS